MYEVDLHINSVSNNEMGYIYEEMLRRFTENSAAGEQYTPREVIRLCMEMLFMGKKLPYRRRKSNIYSRFLLWYWWDAFNS